MHAPQMLIQVLLAREARPRTALAIAMRTHARGFRAAVLLVDLALVAKQAAGVGEALDFLAARLGTDVRAGVFVHVFPKSGMGGQ